MSQRHDHDAIATLPWPGAADPKDLRYVPPELRDLVAAIPADVERKLRRDAGRTTETYRADGRGHGPSRTLNPKDNDADLEIAVVWKKIEWARQQLHSERVTSEQAARDAAGYTCPCCGEVASPSAIGRDRHTQRRTLSDGTVVVLCGKCATVAEQLAVERLGAEMIEGRSRADRARRLIAEATS